MKPKTKMILKVNGIYRCSLEDCDDEIMIITEIGTEIGVPTLYGETLQWLTNKYHDRSKTWGYNISSVNNGDGYKFEYLGQKEDHPEYFL